VGVAAEAGGAAGVTFRSRFAARFSDTQADRAAFKSPFWPFVLATTSVGQEGLDFHTYCHAVVHWNLPHNPVDLEQREGRVHRYKGHAVRKNVARHHGGETLHGTVGTAPQTGLGADPWWRLFALAADAQHDTWRDLVPFWVFPAHATDAADARIERCVLALPLSRESVQLERLKGDLAAYRMVFGQPRQDDLLQYLQRRFSTAEIDAITGTIAVDLSPPKSGRGSATR
jgi:hypothetical protein